MNKPIEILFWSVYRNKYLRNHIYGFLKQSNYKLKIYTYDEIIYSEWCIRYGYLELLKDKVNRGDPLIFTTTCPTGFFENDLSQGQPKIYNGENEERTAYFKNFDEKDDPIFTDTSIFNVFKDDFNFYSNLFKNYPNYFKIQPQDPQLKDGDKEIEYDYDYEYDYENSYHRNKSSGKPIKIDRIIDLVLVYDVVAAYKVLVEQKYYNFSESEIYQNFLKSFDIGSINVADYIFNNHLNRSLYATTEQIETYWDKYLFEHFKSNLFLSKFKFMIKVLNSETPTLSMTFLRKIRRVLKNRINKLIHEQTVGDLFVVLMEIVETFTVCGKFELLESFFSSFEALKNFNTSYSISNKLSKEKYKLLTLDQLIEIKSNLTNQKQLELVIGTCKTNENIGKLYEMAIYFSGDDIYRNYVFYKAKYHNEFFDRVDTYPKSSFAHYDCDGIRNLNFDYQFQYYQQDDRNEKIKQYIELAVADNLNDNILDDDKLKREDIYLMVIKLNDLELLKSVFNQFDKHIRTNYVYGNLKSIEMFDFIYNNTPPQYTMIRSIINNKEIINHFKNQYPSEYNELISSNFKDVWSFGNLKELGFVLNNWQDFKHTFSLKDIWIRLSVEKHSLSYYIETINNIKSLSSIGESNYHYGCSSLLEYKFVLENYPNDIESCLCQTPNDLVLLMKYLKKESNLKEILTGYESIGPTLYKELLDEIIKRNDIKSLDCLIEIISSANENGDGYIYDLYYQTYRSAIYQTNFGICKHLAIFYKYFKNDFLISEKAYNDDY